MNRFVKSCLLTVGASYSLLFAGGDLGVYDIVVPVAESCVSGCDKNTYYIDNKAKLMWEDMTFSNACDGAYKNDRSVCKAGDLSYAKNFCSTLNYAGHSDWRLPTSHELMEVSKQKGVFKNNRGADFWTSTPAASGKHYVVFTVDGFRYARSDSQSNYIRCVRCTAEK
ncbi:MAG: DUF1566 domain-containing protein [Epsilonproteobacteria bacterium]|nr:DUF1566 domain-containing protein [Campylobacterota bacterium]